MERAAEPRGTLNEKRWGEVLGAASQVFGAKGYASASLQEIAERSGILKGSLSYYVRTKEDLLYEILRRSHEDGVKLTVEDDSLAASSPMTRLDSFIRRWMSGIQDMPYRAIGGGRYELIHFLSEDRQREIIALRRRLNQYVTSIIEEGISVGEFSPDLDPQWLTGCLFTLMNGTKEWFDAVASPWEDVAAWYAELACHGVACRSEEVVL
jgi:TetR/AcrR family transcriptional regulator, cholesterol catabolism regulator